MNVFATERASIMKTLILGVDGMLGHVMAASFLLEKNLEVYVIKRKSNFEYSFLNIDSKNIFLLDNLKENILKKIISNIRPDFVINCLGIVKQSKLINNYTQMISINSLLPHKLAKICESFNSKLVHFSTDCVFSGNRGFYKEFDNADSVENYGRSKFLGEVNYGNTITLRTSFFGHQIKNKYSLLEWFLAQRKECQGYVNHIYSGLPTNEIAKIVKKFVLTNVNLSGLYHVSNNPINKYNLLKLFKKIYKKDIKIFKNLDTSLDRSLDSSLFRMKTGYEPPSWEKTIEEMYKFHEKLHV